jgi:formate C-acetyltransferase
MDQYLYPFYARDIERGALSLEDALEITECLFLKFNQIVYLRSSSSAKYFAGFRSASTCYRGQDERGGSAENELTFLFLRAQSTCCFRNRTFRRACSKAPASTF